VNLRVTQIRIYMILLYSLSALQLCIGQPTLESVYKENQLIEMCKTVAKFTPQFCEYESAKQHCSSTCNAGEGMKLCYT